MLNRLLKDDLFRDSSILISTAIIGGALNYVYQIFIGRILGPEEFGIFGLFYMLMILSEGVNYCSTKYMSKLPQEERSGFLRGFIFRVVILTLGVFLLLIASSLHIASFLKIDDPLLVVIVALAPLFGLVNACNIGAMRGLQKFVAMGVLNVGIAVIKLIAGICLVVLGYGVYGALGAVVVSMVIGLALTTVYLRNHYHAGSRFHDFREVYSYALPSILVGFCFIVPANADVIVVKHLFTSTEAGLYTSISVLGKILIFLPIGIIGAMFPKVSKNHSEGDGTVHLLKKALLYTGSLTILVATIYALFPDVILKIFFGLAYTEIAYLLPWYAVALVFFSLALVILNYHHAIHEKKTVKLFAALSFIEIILMYVFGGSMLQVVQIMLVINAVAFVMELGIVYKKKVRYLR